uniref:Uncharacterized protein n=1 Tax=Arundo donax TaxID=35708 RepID=A0A0A9EUF7_ARUDO
MFMVMSLLEERFLCILPIGCVITTRRIRWQLSLWRTCTFIYFQQ